MFPRGNGDRNAKFLTAVGDGIADDTIAIQNWLNSAKENDVLIAPKGKIYKVTSTLIINAPKHTEIKFYGVIDYVGNGNAIVYTSKNSSLYIASLLGDLVSNYTLFTNVGVLTKNCVTCDIYVNEVIGFGEGIRAFGGEATTGMKGYLYTNVKARTVSKCVTALVLKCDTTGYVNENIFEVNWIDGVNGIDFQPDGTPGCLFDGNKFYNAGFEQITGFGMRLRHVSSNLVIGPRFENALSAGKFSAFCIDEDNTCKRNMFILSEVYFISKVSFNGLGTQVYGNGCSDTGDYSCAQMISNIYGERVWHASTKSDYDFGNDAVVITRDSAENLFDHNFVTVRKGAVIKKVNFEKAGYQTVTGADLTVSKSTNIIDVNAIGTAVALTMPKERELNGTSDIILNARFANAGITIKKSSGSLVVASGIITRGLWMLSYYSDCWFATKISNNNLNVVEPQATTTFDPPSLATGSSTKSANITVTGAVVGDFVSVSAPYDLQGIMATAYVSAADTVVISLINLTGTTIDLASGSWKVRVTKV